MTKREIENKVDLVLSEKFLHYEIEDVPDIENKPDLRLTSGNTGLSGEFSFLSVGMHCSADYTDEHRLHTMTKIYKAYHHCMVECIKENDGRVRSFDGDRVLAVFDGKRKVNNAMDCAMKMVGCRYDILQPKILAAFSNDSFSLGVGISTGAAMVSKAGAGYDKTNRDLIWIGTPPILSAKLSEEADAPYSIYICKNTFERLLESNRYISENETTIDMWTKAKLKLKNKNIDIYKTRHWRPI